MFRSTHYDSEDDLRTGCRKGSRHSQQQSVFRTTFNRTIMLELLVKWLLGWNLLQNMPFVKLSRWFCTLNFEYFIFLIFHTFLTPKATHSGEYLTYNDETWNDHVKEKEKSPSADPHCVSYVRIWCIATDVFYNVSFTENFNKFPFAI